MAILPLFLSRVHMVGKSSLYKVLIISVLFGAFPAFSQATSYLEIKAKSGDGITVVLNRYLISNHECGVDSFLELNNLKASSYLILDKKYKLPIRVHEYNGTSIRSSLGINDYQLALRIQKYNELMLSKGLRDKDFRLDKELWVPLHEFYCPNPMVELESIETVDVQDIEEVEAPDMSEALRVETFPILGPKYEKTPIISSSMEGHVYYLISGHGGPDPGAIGHKDGHMLCEDEYAYDVTLRLARNLLQQGATVYMITRDTDGIRDEEFLSSDKDETVWYNQRIPLNQVRRLRQRTAKINELYAKHKAEGAKVQRVIEIHIDSRYETQKVDIFFYYYPGSSKGQAMANEMYSTIKAEYDEHQANRGYRGVVRSRNLHTLRESAAPAVYIELGNITNEFDQKRLLIVNNRQAIANWLALGIKNYSN